MVDAPNAPGKRKGRLDPKANARRAATHKAHQKIRKANKAKPGKKKFGAYRRNLGPMGVFGWDTIIEVNVTVKPSDAKIAGSKSVKSLAPEFNDTNVRILLDHMVYRPLAGYLWGDDVTMDLTGYPPGIIQTLVPRDTGALRGALLQGVQAGKPSVNNFPKTPFLMEVGTPNVDYAKPVNKMPQGWLRHPKDHPKRRNQVIGRSGDILNDPYAKQGWYNLLLLNGRNKAKKLFDDFKKHIVGVLSPLKTYKINTGNYFDALFKARFK